MTKNIPEMFHFTIVDAKLITRTYLLWTNVDIIVDNL